MLIIMLTSHCSVCWPALLLVYTTVFAFCLSKPSSHLLSCALCAALDICRWVSHCQMSVSLHTNHLQLLWAPQQRLSPGQMPLLPCIKDGPACTEVTNILIQTLHFVYILYSKPPIKPFEENVLSAPMTPGLETLPEWRSVRKWLSLF